MTYNYCPNCGEKFENDYLEPWLCAQCKYRSETSERLAELREKYGNVSVEAASWKKVAALDVIELLNVIEDSKDEIERFRLRAESDLWEAEAAQNAELLADRDEEIKRLRARSKSIRPGLDVERWRELRGFYSESELRPSNENSWKQVMDRDRRVINELLDAAGATPAKPAKYDYMETIGELIEEIERIRRDNKS